MKSFAYARPDDLAAATRLAQAEGSAFLAGGQSLLRDMKRGRCRHDALIDIGRLVGRGIEADAGGVLIEAGATHAQVAASPLIRERLPMLAAMVEHIADPLVRHRATIGGALAANEPAGDYSAVALALDATIVTTARRLSAEALLTGRERTALARGEAIVAVAFPIPAKAGYAKILNPAARYAMVGACAVVAADGTPRVGITGASVAGAFRWRSAEEFLTDRFQADALAAVALHGIVFREDLFADAHYRAHLVRVMAARAIDAARSDRPLMVYSHGAAMPR